MLSANNGIQENGVEIVAGTNVFYNPVQEFNRDLSIAVLNEYYKCLQVERANATTQTRFKAQKKDENQTEDVHKNNTTECKKDGLRILEALSATGLRSIRYAKEINGVQEIIANDLSKEAVNAIRENVAHNKVEHLVKPNFADAMYEFITPNKIYTQETEKII